MNLLRPSSAHVTDARQPHDQQQALRELLDRHSRWFVLTGAGCSTDSGIPDYRDGQGQWKRTPPVTYQAFIGQQATRQRYWARSLIGWRRFGSARPNATHYALAALQRQGRQQALLTQNVDGLHQAAGSTGVIDLHGRLDQVRCLQCEHRLPRMQLQQSLVERNPQWAKLDAVDAPDGDADLDAQDFSDFAVPACPQCQGMLKPDVVFFGENVPRARVELAGEQLEQADAMLVVGSSLMVYSGYRFVLAAARAGKPIVAINLGQTRADALLTLKIEQPCAEALSFLMPAEPPL